MRMALFLISFAAVALWAEAAAAQTGVAICDVGNDNAASLRLAV